MKKKHLTKFTKANKVRTQQSATTNNAAVINHQHNEVNKRFERLCCLILSTILAEIPQIRETLEDSFEFVDTQSLFDKNQVTVFGFNKEIGIDSNLEEIKFIAKDLGIYVYYHQHIIIFSTIEVPEEIARMAIERFLRAG